MTQSVVSQFGKAALMGLCVWGVAGQAAAEVRPEVVELIKPVGQVSVQGKPAVAAKPAAAPAATPTAAPAAKPAAAAPAAVAAPAAPAAAVATAARSGEEVYKAHCIACHMTGAANAPIFGNKEAWAPRIAKGIDALMQSAVNGTAAGMPPRGTCATCTDAELKGAIEYMTSAAK